MTVRSRLGWVSAASASPSAAHAHATFGGAGDSIALQAINGVLHPFVVLQHLLLLIVVGFLMGRQASRTLDRCAVVGGLALAVGLVFSNDSAGHLFLIAITTMTVAAGLVVASGWWSNSWLTLTIVALSCLLVGLDSPAAATASTPEIVATHIGSWIGVSAALFYAGFAMHAASRQWSMIGLRILSSWLTAVSVMLLALTVANPA